jgi:hypothetical protein
LDQNPPNQQDVMQSAMLVALGREMTKLGSRSDMQIVRDANSRLQVLLHLYSNAKNSRLIRLEQMAGVNAQVFLPEP